MHNSWLAQPVLCHWAMSTTSPHNPLYMNCTGGSEMPWAYTWQPRSMCHQNLVRDWLENSLHQEITHVEWFSQSKTVKNSCNKENSAILQQEILYLNTSKRKTKQQKIHKQGIMNNVCQNLGISTHNFTGASCLNVSDTTTAYQSPFHHHKHQHKHFVFKLHVAFL